MHITKELVRFFEKEQIDYGTRVALQNLLALLLQTSLQQVTGKRTKIVFKDKR